MNHFVNSASAIVTDAVDGLLLGAEPGRLARLDGYPAIRVVVRAERDPSRVAVVSGGGSGHEPAHAGLVGEGLLDAAVCGDIFASPSVDAVLAGILAVTGPAGCLLIVKNYGGDRLNFGLAAERARALGLKVEMTIVGDDIALPTNPRPRGIAGTAFVHKAAGQAAALGLPLDEVRRRADAVAGAVRSLGVAVTTCTIPGRAGAERIAPGEVEIGLGIHGEPGVERVPLPTADALVRLMLGRFGPDVREAPRLALLLNNLGGVPAIEMTLLAGAIMKSEIGPRIELLLGPATVVSALDMRGFSLSFLPLDDGLAETLTAPVAAPDWPTPRRVSALAATRAVDSSVASAPETPSSHAPTRALLARVCETLIASRTDLDALDAKVGDGDTGSTFAAAAERILADLDDLPLAEPAKLCAALARRLTLVMGGSSGVLLAIFAAAAGAALGEGRALPDALTEGASRLQHYGGAVEGDRTLLDALLPTLRLLSTGADLQSAAEAARAGALATAGMAAARAGRSSYLAAGDLAGVIDPGAEAIARIFEALASDGAWRSGVG